MGLSHRLILFATLSYILVLNSFFTEQYFSSSYPSYITRDYVSTIGLIIAAVLYFLLIIQLVVGRKTSEFKPLHYLWILAVPFGWLVIMYGYLSIYPS